MNLSQVPIKNLQDPSAAVPAGDLALPNAPEQLALFPVLNPLKERFDAAFYRQVPETPGIYWMLDERAQTIYVGKAKNLRQRLRSYRQLPFARQSRKTRRLLLSIHSIQWLERSDETTALLAENACLRALKPRFNVVNTSPESYAYFAFRVDGALLRLRMVFDATVSARDGDFIAGPFKGVARLRRIHASLVRWIWAEAMSHCEWPLPLNRSLSAPMDLNFSAVATPCEDLSIFVQGFLNGLAPLPERVLPDDDPSFYLQTLWRDDQLQLHQFFSSCQRLATLRRVTGRDQGLISRDELDDLTVLAGRDKREQRAESPHGMQGSLPIR